MKEYALNFYVKGFDIDFFYRQYCICTVQHVVRINQKDCLDRIHPYFNLINGKLQATVLGSHLSNCFRALIFHAERLNNTKKDLASVKSIISVAAAGVFYDHSSGINTISPQNS